MFEKLTSCVSILAAVVVCASSLNCLCFGQDQAVTDSVSETQRSREWPQLKGDSGFTGLSSDETVKPPLKLVWSYRLDGDASGDAGAGVIVAGGKVFVSVANSHSIVALNAENGSFCWEYRDASIGQVGYLGHAPVPAYHNGHLVLWKRRDDSGVTVLDADTGEVQWQRPLSSTGRDTNRGGLPVANGLVYCSEGGPLPAVVTFDVATGKQIWRTELGPNVGEYAIGPTVAGGRVFISTRANTRRGPKQDNLRGAITALDAKTGQILWRRKNVYSWSAMVSDGEVLVCPMWSSPDAKLYLLDCATGDTIWVKPRADNHYNPPVTLTKDLVLYQPWGPKLDALVRATGEPLWSFHNEFTSAGCCTPAVSGRFAYLGTAVPKKTRDIESLRSFALNKTPSSMGKYGTVNAIDLSSGKSVWRFPTANTVCGDPAIAYGRLYFASRDGRVYCCAPAKQDESMTPEATDQSPPVSEAVITRLLAKKTTGKQPAAANVPLKPPLALAWKFDTRGRVLTSSAIVNGVVYAASESGFIFAVDAKHGRKIWEFDTGQRVKCSPVVVDGSVYCGSDNGKFFALDAATGMRTWQFEAGGPIQASPAVVGGVIVFGASDHNVYALNRHTGQKLWNFRGDSFCMQATPVIHGDRVYTAQWADWVWCLDLKTGKPIWKSFIPVSIESLSWYRGRLWVRSPYFVTEIDPDSGKRLRVAEASYGYGGMAFVDDRLYQSGIIGQYGTDGATFIRLNGQEGPLPDEIDPSLTHLKMLKPEPLLGNPQSAPTYSASLSHGRVEMQGGPELASMGTPLALGDKLCFATLLGKVILTDLDGKQLWDYKLSGTSHASPVAADGLLVIGCDDGNLYAFREQKQVSGSADKP